MSDQNEIVSLDDLAEQINIEHGKCEHAARLTFIHAMNAGRMLIEAKGRLFHGEWLPWISAHCNFKSRTAQGYMRLAQGFGHLVNAQRDALLDDESGVLPDSIRRGLALLAVRHTDELEDFCSAPRVVTEPPDGATEGVPAIRPEPGPIVYHMEKPAADTITVHVTPVDLGMPEYAREVRVVHQVVESPFSPITAPQPAAAKGPSGNDWSYPDEWSEWLQGLAEHTDSTIPDVMVGALAYYASLKGYDEPQPDEADDELEAS